MKTIALFHNHPECSTQCCDGVIRALSSKYKVKLFTADCDLDEVLDGTDAVFFPGGIGDSDTYFNFFTRTKANRIADFIHQGGRYIGICMGAYWAGSRYFDLLEAIDAVQYIKRVDADVKRSYGTVADIEWLGQKEKMFFYDGCTFTGSGRCDIIAKYSNGEPMAIIQGNLGLIGCHPESEEFWYQLYPYTNKHWHNEKHHRMLLEFVDRVMESWPSG